MYSLIRYWTLLAAIGLAAAAKPSRPNKFLGDVTRLQDLCRDKSTQINKISQVRGLVKRVKLGDSCPNVTKDALLDLDTILSSGLDDICSDDMVRLVRSFHLKYLARKEAQVSNSSIPLPLERFFLGFGLRVSSACKRNLIDHLITNKASQIPMAELVKIEKYVDKFGLIFNRANIGHYEFALSMAESGRGLLLDEERRVDHWSVQTAFARQLRDIQQVCNRYLRPIYDARMGKLASLSSIGLSYISDEELNDKTEKADLHFWYKIISSCDFLSTITVFDFTEEDKQAGADPRTIKILNDEDARSLLAPTEKSEVKPIEASKPAAKFAIDDVVIGESDINLTKSINKLTVRQRHDGILNAIQEMLSRSSFAKGLKILVNIKNIKSLLPARKKVAKENVLEDIQKRLNEHKRANSPNYNPDSSLPKAVANDPGNFSTMGNSLNKRTVKKMASMILLVVVVVALCFAFHG